MPQQKNQLLNVKQAAKVLGMSTDQVRYNVPPSFRTVGGHRRYWLYDLYKWQQATLAK